MAFESDKILTTEKEVDEWFANNDKGMIPIEHIVKYRGKITATYHGLKCQVKNGKHTIVYEYRSPLTGKQVRYRVGLWRVEGCDLKGAKVRHAALSKIVIAGGCPQADRNAERDALNAESNQKKAARADARARRTQTFDEYFYFWMARERAAYERTKGSDSQQGFSTSREKGYRGCWRKWGKPLHLLYVGCLNDKFARFYLKCMSGASIDGADYITHDGGKRRDLDALPFLPLLTLVDTEEGQRAEPFALNASGTPFPGYAGADVAKNMLTIMRGIAAECRFRAEDGLADMPPISPTRGRKSPTGIDLDFLTLKRRPAREWTPEELIAIYRHAHQQEDADERSRQHHLCLLLIILTGCRKSEIIDARRSWFRTQPGYMVIPETKNGKPHHVWVTQLMREVLVAATSSTVRSIDDDRLFPMVSAGTFWERCKRMERALDLPELWPHAFRSAFQFVAIQHCGAQETYVDACLNHTIKGVSAVGRKSYGVTASSDRMRQTWNQVSEWYDRHAVKGEPLPVQAAADVQDLSFI